MCDTAKQTPPLPAHELAHGIAHHRGVYHAHDLAYDRVRNVWHRFDFNVGDNSIQPLRPARLTP